MNKQGKGFWLITATVLLATIAIIAFFVCGVTKIINPTSVEWIIAGIALFGLIFLSFCCWCIWDSFYRERRSNKNEHWH